MTTATPTKPKTPKRGSSKTKTLDATRAAKAARDHETPDPTTDSLQLFFNEARKYPLLTAAEEIMLAKRIEKGDMIAKDRMINSNLRLVISVARKYQGQGLTLGDLIQEGMLGLILPVEEVIEIRRAARPVSSLDQPVGEDGETALGDLLTDDRSEPADEVAESASMQAVQRAVSQLPERERNVVELRFGINGEAPTPLRETGRRLGLSAERVRQLEEQALATLARSGELDTLREAA
jgi:DNA-directed RNA polymerase sigma subunit (sigma70/sigma32)